MNQGMIDAMSMFYNEEDMMDVHRYKCMIQYVISMPVVDFEDELMLIGYGFSEGDLSRIAISIENKGKVIIGKVYIFDTVMDRDKFFPELPRDHKGLIKIYKNKIQEEK